MEGIGNTPVAFLCSSRNGIASLVEAAGRCSKGGDFLLMVKKDDRLIKRLIPAYLNARIRQAESAMKARTLPMEMLLFISGTLRTGKAVQECGASDSRGFILFSNSIGVLKSFAKKMKISLIRQYNLELDLDVAVQVASTALLED